MVEVGKRVLFFQKRAVLFFYTVVLCLSVFTALAQTTKYPATINPTIGQPTSIFLSDYVMPGSNLLTANVVFNDFNEPSWTFKLRVKIQSADFRMETLQGYRPPTPITVTPGVITTLSGADFENYFNYNNATVSGISVSDLVSSGGRLKEGLYTFCFQVLDYETGDPLSPEVCQNAYIKLLEAPRITAPMACGTRFEPTNTQHNFAWQLFDAPSPNATDPPQFQLTLWEATATGINIQTAVANGQALQVFKSDLLTNPNYAYSLSDPQLEKGKQYIFRVQAIDPNGRDKFKNQGYSEYCAFYYGWPTGGSIVQRSPIEGGGFKKKDIPTFIWNPVNTQLPGQAVSYEITVAPINQNQTKESAIINNAPWQVVKVPESTVMYDRGQEVDKPLAVMTKYAWQIKAFSNQQEIGKSGIATFSGPPLMETFYVSVHTVMVDYLSGSDANDLSGGGRMKFAKDGNWVPVQFQHISLKESGGDYVMTGGEFFYVPPQPIAVALTPVHQPNGTAYFDATKFRVDKDGIYAEGRIRWPLPLPATSGSVPIVTTDVFYANFNDFAINTGAPVSANTSFTLLEPYNFKLGIHTSSYFYVNTNNYWLEFNGDIELPDQIKGEQPGLVKLPFTGKDQLHYFTQDSIVVPAIAPVQKAGMYVRPTRFVVDFSDSKSPEELQANPAWKGIYFEEFDLELAQAFDQKGQFRLIKPYLTKFTQPGNAAIDGWITARGVNLKFDAVFTDTIPLSFQSFPSHLTRLKLEIDGNQVSSSNSFLKGKFRIPIISPDERFTFTVPINNLGFDNGSLDNLINTEFVHNPGSGDQELSITVKRAVFSGFEKIAMTVDLEWPSLGVALTDLRGFNAWGDYTVGFDNRNGTVPLTQRVNATLSGYPITIGVIGAGSNNGTYIIATTADASLGDDVSGGNDVPSINIYSVVANQYVPAEASGTVVADQTDQISFNDASANVNSSFEELEQTLVENVRAQHQRILDEAEAEKNNLASANDGTMYAAEDIVPGDDEFHPAEMGQGGEPATEDGNFNSRQQEIIRDIAAGFVEELSRPLLDPLKKRTDSLSLAVATSVNGLLATANAQIDEKVYNLVMGVANKIATAVSNDKVDVSGPVIEMGERTAERISLEIKNSLKLAATNNIIEPVNILLKEKVYGRVNKHITDHGTEMVYAAVTGRMDDSEEELKKLVNGAPAVIEAVIKDVFAFVSIDNMRSTVDAMGSDLIRNISVSAIGHDLRVAAEEIAIQAVAEQAGEALSNLAAQYAADAGLGDFGLAGDNPINFDGAAQRIAQGDVKGVFAIDPVRVQLRTPVINLDGFIKYTPDHPVYGDVWLGDIDMTIKVPKSFAFNAIYFNGRKDEIAYWFCQITPPEANNTPYELGKPLPKAAKELETPVDIGIAQIVGAAGRLYHHMKETPGSGIVPDASMHYGAYMHFVFYDKKSDGQNLRLEVSGEINTAENGDYTIAFDGNLQIRSTNVNVREIDKNAAIQGLVSIRYNSAEEHFLGYAEVIINQPGKLCAQASLLVDVKPGKWRVAIGSRENRIIFVPGCAGWSPTGWLDLNETIAELGLGIQYSGGGASPKIDLGFIGFYVEVQAGIAFGIQAKVQYKPSFALLEAGVWVDVWASIIAHYKLPLKDWKSKTLVDIYIRGDLLIIFQPPPTMVRGTLDGTASIVGFNVEFHAKIEKTI